MSRNAFLWFLPLFGGLKNIYIPHTSKKENVHWDFRGLIKDNQVIKWIELIYDLREIKHMFYLYLLFLNS